MAHIDSIKVQETRRRLTNRKGIVEVGVRGADALLWFSKYAKNGTALRPYVDVVDCSTTNAKIAQSYLNAAVKEFNDKILERAVELAQSDYDRGHSVICADR